MPEYRLVTDAKELRVASNELAQGTGPVAVDVERASGFRYWQRAYLVQVFRRGAGAYLIDPTTVGETTPLREAIAHDEWVLHAASQDLPSLRELDLVPDSIFDTELAARLLGFEKVGLGAIVEEILGIKLAKEHSAADWSTRPLPESWLDYAALDVIHLVDVRDYLADKLVEEGKSEFALQEFEASRVRLPRPSSEEPWRRLSGLHQIKGARNLTVASELWLARDELAQAKDISPGRLVPDRSLVAAVLADPKSKADLARVKDFHGRASRTELDRWWAAIERGRVAPEVQRSGPNPDSMPPVRAWAEQNPEADARIKLARPAVEHIAKDLRMPTENLLTPDFLRRVAWQPSDITEQAVSADLISLGARPWQVELTAHAIAEAFVEASQSESDAESTDS